jgi:hypothetical protein
MMGSTFDILMSAAPTTTLKTALSGGGKTTATGTINIGMSGLLFIPSLLPPLVPADVEALSLSFCFLGGSSGGGIAAGAANSSTGPLLSFGYLGGKPAATLTNAAAVGGSTRGFSFLSGSRSGGGGVVIVTAETSTPPHLSNVA